MARRFPLLLAVAALGLVAGGCASGDTAPATDVTDTAATLNATGNPNGVQTSYWFQYGTTTAYGTETTQRDGGSGTQVKTVSEQITGLSPSTTYHFRVVAQQSGRPAVYGSDRSFSTLPAPSTKADPVPAFAVYYLWWDRAQWVGRLGSAYPYNEVPSPLPATLDSTGCAPVSLYPGNQLTDVSQGLSYDVSKPAVMEQDVRAAAAAGLRGFAVNWAGTGSASQDPTSTAYNRRLQALFDAVHRVNAEGTPFKLLLDYKAGSSHLSSTYIANDLTYFLARYGADSALDHTYSPRPEVVWRGSRNYSDSEISAVSQALRPRLYLLGDESVGSWDAGAAANFDGNSYYWSSQNPYKNPASFSQLQSLASNVRSTKNPDGSSKAWLAPLAPGYNNILLVGGSTCVPRNGGDALQRLFQGNLASNPDGWTLISWNEIAESTYIVPLTRYGDSYLDKVKALIAPSP